MIVSLICSSFNVVYFICLFVSFFLCALNNLFLSLLSVFEWRCADKFIFFCFSSFLSAQDFYVELLKASVAAGEGQ